ncbi:MAG: MBL fold metallo-hydrolase [Flavobacteriaceae bacterium]|nr:MAG: MBL fold metallo-hydrolase [Flavobacteriaceae bacterium]
MKIEQIYTGCLAHGAYFISSNGEAVVIDPLREIKPYLEKAERENVKIKYIFETHFHADFVSGHKDLAEKTGAKIVYGPTGAKLGFDAHIAKDGEIFPLGEISFQLLHTPGHTLESSCFLLLDKNQKPHSLYSGDTLFIGDVGRPDLAQKIDDTLTQDKLAGMLYDSLREKIMPLPDDVIVYPAHGAGSACGKNMSKETFDTLGNQKKNNYALAEGLSRENFIAELTSGLPTPPAYFPQNVMMNILGADSSIDSILDKSFGAGLSPEKFEELVNQSGALVLDTRKPADFASGFVPNSVFIGIDGSFAPWVGTLIEDIKHPLALVCEEGCEEEVITRLARVGYDNVLCYLKGGIKAWKEAGKEIDHIESISPEEAYQKFKEENLPVVDVRKPSENLSQRIENAINLPLDAVGVATENLDKNKTYLVHCAGGYRSMIFNSILRARGYDHLIDIKGGFTAIVEDAKFPLTNFVCPSTLS